MTSPSPECRRVLFIGKVWPEPRSSAAGTRLLQLAGLFTARGDEVYFGSPAQPTSFSDDPAGFGIKPFAVQLNNHGFEGRLRELSPDIVVFDRFSTEEQFGWKVAEACPAAIRILDTEDLHCLRAARQTAHDAKREMHDDDLFNDVAKREIAAIFRSDLSLIISTAEMRLLTDFFGVNPDLLCYAPFLYKKLNNDDRHGWSAYQHRSHFAGIGNFLHAPNLDAALYLRDEIWPLISAALPQVEMRLYGAYSEKVKFRLQQPENRFFLMGRAASSAEVMRQARVCLAPLRIGAGMKGKLAEAMMHGTPSVTTSIGAEGMGDAESWPGRVEDKPALFAEAAIQLYSSETEWNGARDRCFTRFNELFDEAVFSGPILDRIEGIFSSPAQHRRRNFTGSMLMHHALASHRWLGKYIELKNQGEKQPE